MSVTQRWRFHVAESQQDEQVVVGDCLVLLRQLPTNSVDAVVTDPPAGINFMGAKWDNDKGGRKQWIAWLTERMRECLRVLKPGGHMLVWALPRTSHWTATALENAGFQIRDRHSHFFGTGFPKSANVSKLIDKRLGVEPTVVGANPNHRAVSGVDYGGVYAGGNTGASYVTEASSEEAKQWEGYSTALKPACEDWWLVRKPLEGTIADNVLMYGTGALNIDACRIPTDEPLTRKLKSSTESASGWKSVNRSPTAGKDGGRWPAHISFDEEAAALLDTQSGVLTGGASRFFYVAKAPQSEKHAAGKNTHPTVKSVTLMRWLIRLITPPGGLVLDPFCGSGSTGVACALEGFRFKGFEQKREYVDLARKRIAHAEKYE